MSKKEPDFLSLDMNHFPNSWVKMIHYNLRHGFYSNKAYESIIALRLHGEAVKQILNHEVHPQFPFGVEFINAYCREFTYEFLEEYLELSVEDRFSYLYFQRFVKYPSLDGLNTIDQVKALHDNLRNTENSRQLQMITYIPAIDLNSVDPPCLQRVQIRQLDKDKVDLHYEFRSWDVCMAYPSNIIALTDMVKNYITKDDYVINSVNIFARSGHVYDSDMSVANNVKLMQVMPHFNIHHR